MALANHIESTLGLSVNPNALFDVQVKRIHEYKRQYLNILSVIHRYMRIKAMTPEQRKDVVPRVIIFGGKAAPGTLVTGVAPSAAVQTDDEGRGQGASTEP